MVATRKSRVSERDGAGNQARRRPGRAVHAVLVLVVLATTPAVAYAIPSPDVVVNVFTGMAQGLIALGAALGSLVVAATRAFRRGDASSRKLWALTLLTVLIGSLFFNYYQHHAAAKERSFRLSRNLVRSSVQNGQAVQDVSLKVLSRSDQLDHSLGITTEDLARIVRSGNGRLLVDVREDEEFASGRITGTVHLRYPDLREDTSQLRLADEPPIFLCYSGNRSGELAEKFASEGVACRFMIGGYEKWKTEGRALIGQTADSNARDIAHYPNKDSLLDTPAVESTYADGDVVFIDARYEAEYAASHLPGAVNIPLRKLTSPEVAQALRGVPAGKRFIGACYDKRSSFYALLLGSKLSNLGHTWLGRYTVPGEFTTPPMKIDRAKDEGSKLMAMGLAGLETLRGITGSAALSIVLFVLVLRLLMSPLSILAEASVAAERRARPQLKGITTRKEKDALLKKAGVRPLWGLVSGLALAFVFLTLAVVIGKAPFVEGAPLWPWISDLGKADPWAMLPAAVALLAVVQMQLGGKFSSVRGKVISVALGVAFFFLTRPLPAAINLAIMANVGISALLSAAFVWRDRRECRSSAQSRGNPRGILPLEGAHRFEGVGPKAARLAQLKASGLPVPDGFVLPQGFLKAVGSPLKWLGSDCQALDRAFARLGVEKVAVRSSAMDEDGENQSFAGIFESELDVNLSELRPAVDRVLSSFTSTIASSYNGDKDAGACILVQTMLDADHAGVLFTRHPEYHSEIAIEFVAGCGEALVSGHKDPTRLTVGRASGKLVEGDEASVPFPLDQLVELGLRCEQVFGQPQDVEWAVKDGKVYILQSRDITANMASGYSKAEWIEAERQRLIERCVAGKQPLRREGFSELLPRPTPASLSLLKKMLGPGGAAETVRKSFGMPYRSEAAGDALVSAFGRLYADPAGMARLFPRRQGLSQLSGVLSSVRCHRARDRFTPAWLKEMEQRLQRSARLEGSRDLGSLELAELADVLENRARAYSSEHYAPVEELNVVAAYQQSVALAACEKAGVPLQVNSSKIPHSITYRGEKWLRDVAAGRETLESYLGEFGHRAAVDYELSLPRFSEDPAPVQQMVKAYAAHSKLEKVEEEAPRSAESCGETRARAEAYRFAELSAMKETARHHAVKYLALVREAMSAIGAATGIGDDVFFLEVDEILMLCRDLSRKDELAPIAAARRERWTAFQSIEAVDAEAELDVFQLERLARAGVEIAESGNEDGLRGTCVSGSGTVRGRARVLKHGDALPTLDPEEILVATHTDTSLAPLFAQARGLITEVGGMLSHAAIVAREFGLPAVVGVAGATRRIRTGDLVELHHDGTVTVIEDEPPVEKVVKEDPVSIRTLRGAECTGTVVNENPLEILVQANSEVTVRTDELVMLKVNGYQPRPAKVLRRDGNRLAFAHEKNLTSTAPKARAASAG